MKYTLLATFALWLAFSGCKTDRKFPKAKELSEFKETSFVPTMEHKMEQHKNVVYCATLLFAWEEIRKQINQPLQIPRQYEDLNILNDSKSFISVLQSDEYTAEATVDGQSIRARAAFSRSLPFATALSDFKERLVFNEQKVASFGVAGASDYEQFRNVEIMYYKDDENFIVKLKPKDTNHHIILFTSEQDFPTITAMNAEIAKLIAMGDSEKQDERIVWKYYMEEEDEIIIPKFNFNIQTNYKRLEGSTFETTAEKYTIEEAWQRTAFILDEKGAVIESDATVETTTEAIIEKPKPKKMIFDKPFLILLKRADGSNPYFALWVANTELMVKE